MILPSKHLSQDRALLTVGASMLRLLSAPMTVSALRDAMPRARGGGNEVAPLRYDAFVLALDLLFMLDAINLHDGLVVRKTA